MRAVVAVLATGALGLAAGAMLAEGAVLIPWWRSLPPASFLRWYADNGWQLFAFFGPLEIASAGLSVAAGVLYRHQPGARGLFASSAVLAVAVLALFPLYFQQANASFETGSIPLDRVAGELERYAARHWGRVAIGVLAFGSAVLGVRAAARGDVG
jgi:hypothetical protein